MIAVGRRRSLSLLAVLAAGLAGCRHTPPPAPAPAATAPPLPPTSMTKIPQVPAMPPPTPPQVGLPGSDQAAQAKPEPAHHPRHARRRPATSPAETAAATNGSAAQTSTQASAAAAPPSSEAAEPTLGQLSAGSGADRGERAAMSEQIHVQELRLARIKHPRSADEEAITKQVEAFLSKARQAVLDNDLDGAQTLTTKAKVLLDELAPS